MDKGIVFRIQRFSLQDGPGIRSTVFFKGCPLSCKWCANPESQYVFPEIMLRQQLCQACGECISVCDINAITIIDNVALIDRDKCNRCMNCVRACPAGTLEITGDPMTVQEVMDEVSRDELFYRNSGGGVTLSGGEPLLQPEFAFALLKTCKEKSFHTALDTCGHANWETFNQLLEFTDVVLFDLKHMDPDQHCKGTGVDNKLILDNFKKAVALKKAKVWLRIPVITGYNDSEQQIKQLTSVIGEAWIEKISLLEYHELGKSKYDFLGRPYSFNGNGAPDEKKMDDLKETVMAKGKGIEVTIGY